MGVNNINNDWHDTDAVCPAPSRPRKNQVLRVIMIVSGAVLAFVILMIILNANLLLPWQKGARRNKQVILEYAAEHYPDAEILEQKFNSAHFFVWNNILDCIIFKYDNLEFGITAEAGEILVDGYYQARVNAQFDRIIQDGFFKPRGITAQTHYGFSDNYYEEYPYTGGLGLIVRIRDQGTTPQEIGWLYDFYKYWNEKAAFLDSYSVFIDIVADNVHLHEVRFIDSDVFTSAEEFYTVFK